MCAFKNNICLDYSNIYSVQIMYFRNGQFALMYFITSTIQYLPA